MFFLPSSAMAVLLLSSFTGALASSSEQMTNAKRFAAGVFHSRLLCTQLTAVFWADLPPLAPRRLGTRTFTAKKRQQSPMPPQRLNINFDDVSPSDTRVACAEVAYWTASNASGGQRCSCTQSIHDARHKQCRQSLIRWHERVEIDLTLVSCPDLHLIRWRLCS